MFRKIISAVILIPLVVILLGFAVANRQIVTVSFDPFDQVNPASSTTMPLFALIFVLMIFGAIIGGVAAWLKQSKWRRAARKLEAENRELRAQRDALETRTVMSSRPLRDVEPSPPIAIPPPVP